MGQRYGELITILPGQERKGQREGWGDMCGDLSVYVVYGGGCRWWMTSPLRETFPQPAHKESRQKVKRMRKKRNLTQCVKMEAKCR